MIIKEKDNALSLPETILENEEKNRVDKIKQEIIALRFYYIQRQKSVTDYLLWNHFGKELTTALDWASQAEKIEINQDRKDAFEYIKNFLDKNLNEFYG